MSQIPSPYDPTHGHHHQEHMHSEHCGLCRIELEHVSVSAGGDTLLSDVNMHIHCGQLTALVGPNGAGKTTLVRALLSQIPHTGQIRHMDNQERPLRSVRTGYVPQQLPFDKQMPVTVMDGRWQKNARAGAGSAGFGPRRKAGQPPAGTAQRR